MQRLQPLDSPDGEPQVALDSTFNTVAEASASAQGLHSAENFSCQVRRCRQKRARHGELDAQLLFSSAWREMKIGSRRVWVVELTVRCPSCHTEQSKTLIPPVLVSEPPITAGPD